MRLTRRRGRLLGLLLGLTVVLGAAPLVVSAQEDGEKLVLAFYHASYEWSTWSQSLCDLPSTLYFSSDATAIERHVTQARTAGIDAFVQAWYGPKLAGNPTEANLKTLLDEAQRQGFGVSALVDMSNPLLQSTDDVDEALVALRDGHTRHGAYLQVEGRPVVFFLEQDVLSTPSWEALRNRVDPDHEMIWIAEGGSTTILEVFDGLYIYDLAASSSPNAPLSNASSEIKFWNLDPGHTLQAYWVATVLPGYDDSELVAENEAVVRARSGGEYYRRGWEAAIASAPDWVIIRSFNEWTTCTHIESSEAYQDSYLDLTRELISDYRHPPQVPETPTVTATPASPEPTETAEGATPEPETAMPTDTSEPTATLTPTITLTPSATPFRLSTPTPTAGPGASSHPPLEPGGTPAPGATAGGAVLEPPKPGATPTATRYPRLPVEGAPPRRCSLLPLLLPIAAMVLARRSRQH